MKTYRTLILLVALLLWSAGIAGAQKTPESVHGAPVVVRINSNVDYIGELIAVRSDSLWILSDQKLIGLAFGNINRLDLYRHHARGRRFFWISMAGGLTSATALTAACTTVSDGCAGVFLGVGLVWTLATAVVTNEINSASRRRYRPPYTPAEFTAWSRYPQGFPAGYQEPVTEIPHE